jgi:hypothetical protein
MYYVVGSKFEFTIPEIETESMWDSTLPPSLPTILLFQRPSPQATKPINASLISSSSFPMPQILYKARVVIPDVQVLSGVIYRQLVMSCILRVVCNASHPKRIPGLDKMDMLRLNFI